MNRKRWILRALGLLAMLLVLWVAATLFLSPAYANALPFGMDVRSKLLADYDADDGKSLFAALRLSILGDSLVDQGLSPVEAEGRRLALENSLDDPVPTATALDFDGSAPYTATPTITPTPTHTATPTSTPTNTPRPTSTPTKTNTPKPPTATSGPVDNVAPTVCCVVYSPPPDPAPPGPTFTDPSCKITVVDLEILDPSFSSGVPSNGVCIEYKRPSSSTDSSVLTMTSGDFVSGPGSDWIGHFDGSITLTSLFTGDLVKVKIKGHDNDNNWFASSYSYFTMGIDCP